MDNWQLVSCAMAEQCKALIQKTKQADTNLPTALHPHHHLWMCDRIEKHADD